MLNWDDVLMRMPDIVTRETEDELVVVLPEQGKFVVLNVTGARVLQLADGKRALQDIAALIADEFSVDVARVKEDVLTFAISLIERQVLRTV